MYLVDYNRISEEGYSPEIIQDPSSYFKGNNEWICTPESFLYEKISEVVDK